jgi:MFS transporter, DHA1 family, inner membrane transport protein
MPDTDVTSSVQAPTQHRSQQNPQDANLLRAYGPNPRSIQRALIVLAVGTFAIGTDAFVIGGVLPAVARSLDVSTGSAGLLVTAFAIAYAIGGPILAVATARRPRRGLMVSALALFVAANILAAVAPGYATMLIAQVLAAGSVMAD